MPRSPEKPDMGGESADQFIGKSQEVSRFDNFKAVIGKNIEDNKALPEAEQDKRLTLINPEELEFMDMIIHDKMLSGGARKLSEHEFAYYQESVQEWSKEELAKGVLAQKTKIKSRMAFMARMTGLWEEEVKRRKEEEEKRK